MRVNDGKWYIARTGHMPFKLVDFYPAECLWRVEYESGKIGTWHTDRIIPFPVEKTIREVFGDVGYWARVRELFQEEKDMGWSEWEEVSMVSDHSCFYPNCDYEAHLTRLSGKLCSKCRVKLPTRVSISDLKGTVEMRNGQPDWSTYKE